MPLEQEYPDRRFVIFNVTELNQINFSQVLEDSASTVRKSADLTKTFVKYNLPQPSSVAGLTTKSQEYTYDEILVILTTQEWLPAVTGSIPQQNINFNLVI